MTFTRRLSVLGLFLALTGGAVTTTAADAQAGPRPVTVSAARPGPTGVATSATLYQKHVKSTTYSVTVFTSPSGQDTWGTWYSCQNFYTDRTDGIRYHTWVNVGGVTRDAWVTSSSDYVASGWC
jgi:hypothetical protein